MWQKSSYCKIDAPMCVEVADLDSPYGIKVRDSKNPYRAFLYFSREEWQTFIDGVKRGEFDLKTDTTADAEEMMEQV